MPTKVFIIFIYRKLKIASNLVIILSLLFSCNNAKTSEHKSSLRDSLIKLYKEELFVNKKIDTTEFNYRLFNAFYTNDSLALSKLFIELRNERESRIWWSEMDSCIEQQSLIENDIEEGYRFAYDGAFCPYRQITTISKRNDSIKLNFELYQLKWDTAKCRKIESFEKVLTLANWEELISTIRKGDFWGLKTDNDVRGVDGSQWYITGYKKGRLETEPSKYHYVYRWGYTSLREAFDFATLLAANKSGCLTIRKINQ